MMLWNNQNSVEQFGVTFVSDNFASFIYAVIYTIFNVKYS